MHQLPHARTCLGCSGGSDATLIEYIYLKIRLNCLVFDTFLQKNINFLYLVEWAHGEPGVVVEIVVHRAQAWILQQVCDAGGRPANV